MITHLKIADKNISHFMIFVHHSRIKYINNVKWLTKIINIADILVSHFLLVIITLDDE
jgi:hypothetical protein